MRQPNYDALRDHLRSLADDVVVLTVDEIDGLVGGLPKAAYADAEWWSGDERAGRPQAHAWRAAGWRVGPVNLERRLVWFYRDESPRTLGRGGVREPRRPSPDSGETGAAKIEPVGTLPLPKASDVKSRFHCRGCGHTFVASVAPQPICYECQTGKELRRVCRECHRPVDAVHSNGRCEKCEAVMTIAREAAGPSARGPEGTQLRQSKRGQKYKGGGL